MKSLKDKALHRISKLADKAIKNNEFGDDVDKGEVIAAFSSVIEDGQLTPEQLLSTPEGELMRRIEFIVAVEALASISNYLTPEQLKELESSIRGN